MKLRASALSLLVAALGGCASGGGATPDLSAADLQRDLGTRIAESGTTAEAVTCPRDLRGVVDRSVRCEVVFSPTDKVTAVVTTTKVDGANVIWEITRPELTKEQLATRVAGLESAGSATCDTGLQGNVGEWASCVVVKNGMTRNEVVEVRTTSGLKMDLSVTPVLLQDEVEDLLLAKLMSASGQRPDSAVCPGDLIGTQGTTMECVVNEDDNPDKYVLTVTGVTDGAISFDYQTWAAAMGQDPNIDYCRGCPG